MRRDIGLVEDLITLVVGLTDDECKDMEAVLSFNFDSAITKVN